MPFNYRPGNTSNSDASTKGLRLSLNPYAATICLLAAGCVLMYAGDSLLLRYGFPWALFSLLVVGAAANLLGTRPAVLALLLSALFGDLLVPDLHISYFHGHDSHGSVGPIRVLLFLTCGSAVIWLAHAARQIQEEADRRRNVVRALQDMMSPLQLDQVPGYDLHGIYSPASSDEEVGGDFYDVFPVDEGRYGILIGDVVGKGKEAAAYTAMLRYSVRAYAGIDMSPEFIIRSLNGIVISQRLGLGTATLFIGILQYKSGSLIYASAGHEPPMLRHATGGEESLDATGPPLGTGLAFEYELSSITLQPGDILLLMTDGVTEARNEKGKFLASDGTWSILRKSISAPTAKSALEAMAATVIAYIGARQRDDIAMLMIQRLRETNVPSGPASSSGSALSAPDSEHSSPGRKNARSK